MAEINKTGKIPIATTLYETKYQITDTNIGKYISLKGSKEFYLPGVGLRLSAPENGTVSTLLQTNSVAAGQSTSTLIAYGTSYVTFNTGSYQVNDIAGSVATPMSLIYKNKPNTKVLNVQEAGTYSFEFTTSGTFTQTLSKGAIGPTIKFYFTLSGTKISLGEYTVKPVTSGSINGVASFNISYIRDHALKVGDYIEIFGEVDYTSSTKSLGFSTNETTLKMKYTSNKSPLSTVFTNSNNITQFNKESIKFYGLDRDNLILQGNKLTSI